MIIDTYTVNVRFNADKASFLSIDRKIQNLSKKKINLQLTPRLGRLDTRSIQGQLNNLRLTPKISKIHALNLRANVTVNRLDTRKIQSQLDSLHISPSLQPIATSRGATSRGAASSGGSLRGAAVAGGAIVAGSGVSGFAKSSLQIATDFESNLKKATIILKTTAAQEKKLESLAKNVGDTTSISHVDASAGLLMLAKNGATYDQIVGGALSKSVDLSIAMDTKLSPTIDTATDVLAQFKMEMKDFSKAADILLGVTTSSKFTFDDVRLGLGNAGGFLGSVGVEFDDFAVSLAAISSSFDAGAQAGTAFRTMMSLLSPQTKSAIQAMEKLGLISTKMTPVLDKKGNKVVRKDGSVKMERVVDTNKFFTDDGALASMREVFNQLNIATKNLSEKDLAIDLKTIFGVDGMVAAITAAKQGAEGYDKFAASINKASVAENKFAMQQTMKVKIQQLESAWQGFKLSLIDEEMLTFLKNITMGMTGFVGAIKGTNEEYLEFSKTVGNGEVAGALKTIGVGISGIIKLINQAGLAWDVVFGKGVKSKFRTMTDKIEANMSEIESQKLKEIKKQSSESIARIKKEKRNAIVKLKNTFDFTGGGDLTGGNEEKKKVITRPPSYPENIKPVEIKIEQSFKDADPKTVESAAKNGVKQGMTESLSGQLGSG